MDRFDSDGVCGNAISDGAGELGSALETLARENPKVRAFLEGGVEGTAWIGVAFAVAGIAIPIVNAHRPRPRAVRILDEIDAAETPEDLFGYAGNGSPVTTPEDDDDAPSAATISGLPFVR